MEKNMKKITKAVVLNERQLEMITEIQKEDGLPTFSSVFHTMLVFYYKKTFPSYGQGRAAVQATQTRTPDEIAKHQVELKQARKKTEEEIETKKKRHVCEVILGGEVYVNDAGHNYCRYWNYDADERNKKVIRQEQNMPLEMVNPVYGKNLFSPDKETVFEIEPEIAKKFEERE